MPASETFVIRAAGSGDTEIVSSVLTEAARWLISQGAPLWSVESVSVRAIGPERVNYHIAEVSPGSAAGVVKLQTEDAEFWPDIPEGESIFVHRLAVRRRFAGGGLARLFLDFAVHKAEALGKRYVRLDCASDRQKLRAVYERSGFSYHSIRDVGSFNVARYERDLRNKKPEPRERLRLE